MNVKKKSRYSFLCVTIILVLIMSGCSNSQGKYYIKPLKDYEIETDRFPTLDDDIRKEIGDCMHLFVDWYNNIEFADDADEVDMPLNLYISDELEYLFQDLFSYRDTVKEVDAINAISGEAARIMFESKGDYTLGTINFDTGEVSDDVSDPIIHVTPEYWMDLHDTIIEAIEYYYGG